MDSLTTHPTNAQQAKAFTSPASLSFPGGTAEVTPPSSDKDGSQPAKEAANGDKPVGDNADHNGNGVNPTTPAAGQGQGTSGIVPTLQ